MDLQCEGSRNYLSALHVAVENDEEAKHNVGKITCNASVSYVGVVIVPGLGVGVKRNSRLSEFE